MVTHSDDPTATSTPPPPAASGLSPARRAGLTVALILTVGCIGAGTWVLGSGGEIAVPEDIELQVERVDTAEARPPLTVAPPPERADPAGKAGRSSRKGGGRADAR